MKVDSAEPVVCNIAQGGATATWDRGALTEGEHAVVVTARSARAPRLNGGFFYLTDEPSGIHPWDGARSGSLAANYWVVSGGTDGWASDLAVAELNLAIVQWPPTEPHRSTRQTSETSSM